MSEEITVERRETRGGKRPSAVDEHPKRDEIIDLLKSGMRPRTIAAQIQPPISFSALTYYQRRVIPFQRVQAAPNVVNGDKTVPISVTLNDINSTKLETVIGRIKEDTESGGKSDFEAHRRRLIERLHALSVRRQRWLIAAEADHHWTACAQLDGADLRSIEIESRILGLDQAPVAAANSMVISFTSNNLTVTQPQAFLNPPSESGEPALQTIDLTPEG